MFKTIVTYETTSGQKGKIFFVGELLELAKRVHKMKELGYQNIWTEILATIPTVIDAEPAAKSSAA